MPIGVVVDACVLIKASVRDTLIRAYGAGLYRLHWTDDILNEVERNLIADELTSVAGARRLISKLQEVLPEARISGHERLIASMTNHPKDRHVLAAAVAVGAQIIVTDNLRDFPDVAVRDFGITVQSPDDFLTDLSDQHGETLAKIVAAQSGVLRNPPQSVAQVLGHLARDGAPTFASVIRGRLTRASDP